MPTVLIVEGDAEKPARAFPIQVKPILFGSRFFPAFFESPLLRVGQSFRLPWSLSDLESPSAYDTLSFYLFIYFCVLNMGNSGVVMWLMCWLLLPIQYKYCCSLRPVAAYWYSIGASINSSTPSCCCLQWSMLPWLKMEAADRGAQLGFEL